MKNYYVLKIFILLLCVMYAFLPHLTLAQETVFQKGDVVAAIGNGQVNWYRPDGTLVKVLDTGLGGATTGMAFDNAGSLYVTNFDADTVSHFDASGNLLGSFGGPYGNSPESIVVDKRGDFYVGHADLPDYAIRKFDAAGAFLEQFEVDRDDRGSDWIELSPDQCTMFYTSEGTRVKRFNVCRNTQMSDFASGLQGKVYALRLLSDGGVLVADSVDILRLDAKGRIVQTYDAPGEDNWFSLNRDPDGKSFWSGGFDGNLYKFDIATGNILIGPIKTCDRGICLGGVAVFGELTEVKTFYFPWWIIPTILLPLLILLGWFFSRRPSRLSTGRPEIRTGHIITNAPPKSTSVKKGESIEHGKSFVSKPPKR
ncbi:MAG: hypothetical protein JXA21_07395 [Anaerolineae bacterium]|nr:hypothetical protein [Anaerolineae bacterium]